MRSQCSVEPTSGRDVRERHMALKRRNFILVVILSVAVAAAAASPTLAQQPAPGGGAGGGTAQSAPSIPGFIGPIWAPPMLGFQAPRSWPGPVVDKKSNTTG